MVNNKTIVFYVKSILDAIYTIHTIVDGQSHDVVVEDRMKFLSILSVLIHIGECVSIMRKIFPQQSITDASYIVAFRNILAHQYLTIRKGFVRKILDDSLGLLQSECTNILTQENTIYSPSFIEFSS